MSACLQGPWIMADLESGLWGADKVDSEEEPIEHMYVHMYTHVRFNICLR